MASHRTRHTAKSRNAGVLVLWLATAGVLGLAGCDDAVPAGKGGADAAPAGDLGAECRFHSECGIEQLCVEGRCLDPDPVLTDGATDGGRTDADLDAGTACGPGEVPGDGGCVPDPLACTRNADCGRGFACDAETRRCVPDARLCVSRLDCFAGERCIDGQCEAGNDEDAGPRPDRAVDPREDQGLLPLPDLTVRDLAVVDFDLIDASPDLDRGPDTGGAGGEGGSGGEGGMGGMGGQIVLPDAHPIDANMPLDANPVDANLPDANPVDAGPRDAGPPDAFVVLPTPPRGIYSYEKLPVANQRELNRVAFHPSGDYAVVLPVSGPVFVVDWATGAVQRFETGGANPVYWNDLTFTPDGQQAILVGYTVPQQNTQLGVIYHLSDADYRAGAAEVLEHPVTAELAGDAPVGIEYPPGGDRPTVLFSRRIGQGYNAILRDYDPATGRYGNFIAATAAGAGPSDLAYVNDAFGDPGILVTCGLNGADFYFYSFEGGAGAWQPRPGNRNVGNLGAISAYPNLDYALFISWSGSGRIHRFSGGALRAEQVSFGTQSIWRVQFQPDGRRALVVGRQSSVPLAGRIIEYRHDAFVCPQPFNNCDLTDVSIPGFALAPYNASSNDHLNDAAFHPHCDSGLVVGGYSNFNTNTGHLVRFDIVNGAPCPPRAP